MTQRGPSLRASCPGPLLPCQCTLGLSVPPSSTSCGAQLPYALSASCLGSSVPSTVLCVSVRPGWLLTDSPHLGTESGVPLELCLLCGSHRTSVTTDRKVFLDTDHIALLYGLVWKIAGQQGYGHVKRRTECLEPWQWGGARPVTTRRVTFKMSPES